jgi:hypothetical protein
VSIAPLPLLKKPSRYAGAHGTTTHGRHYAVANPAATSGSLHHPVGYLDLPTAEARQVRRDPGEHAIEMLVLDDDAGIELRVILREEAGREHAAVGAKVHRAVLGLADDRDRVAQGVGW